MFAPTAKDAPLYGQQNRSRETSGKEISYSSSLAFSTQLSSLLSAPESSSGRKAQRRARSGKEDIFSSRKQHKATKAKEVAPTESKLEQKHSTRSDGVDSSAWHRSMRKMEDKARLYAAMKRGDVEDDDHKHMVDFDRKWAEQQENGQGPSDASDESTQSESEPEELVEWTDEFGRTRTGSRAQQAREQRSQAVRAENDHRARPAVPGKLIYGDTVQDEAFNPDAVVTDRMAAIAAKRDRSLTPPPETHFDGSKEIRSKGVGFMQFSLDEEQRKKQMESLGAERAETERLRSERERRIKERKDEVERRRQEIQEKRSKRKADAFLDDLGAELDARHQISTPNQ